MSLEQLVLCLQNSLVRASFINAKQVNTSEYLMWKRSSHAKDSVDTFRLLQFLLNNVYQKKSS